MPANSTARVHSIDALRDLRTALIGFSDTSRQALATVDVEIRRTLDWLSEEQLNYWKTEVRRREDKVGEARNELSRCLITRTASGDAPSCYDQKKQLERAKQRLRAAEEKVELVKHWTRIVEQEVVEYRGPAQMMSNLIDNELPLAYELLERMASILDQYVTMSPGDAMEAVHAMSRDGNQESETPASQAADAAPPPKPES